MTLSRPEPTLTGGDFQCRHCRLLAGSSPSLPDGSNPSAAIVQSASDVQCSRLLKTTATPVTRWEPTASCPSRSSCGWRSKSRPSRRAGQSTASAT
ncbi:MAG: hypothetical protein FHK79_22100 [Pseudomonas sp.]|nr:MAG: hypothetical protein FHK79_22100 [Pseudomonas sp.]